MRFPEKHAALETRYPFECEIIKPNDYGIPIGKHFAAARRKQGDGSPFPIEVLSIFGNYRVYQFKEDEVRLVDCKKEGRMGLSSNQGPDWEDDPLGYVNKDASGLNINKFTKEPLFRQFDQFTDKDIEVCQNLRQENEGLRRRIKTEEGMNKHHEGVIKRLHKRRIKELEQANALQQTILDNTGRETREINNKNIIIHQLLETAEKNKGLCQCPHDDNWDCQYHDDSRCLKQVLEETK